MMILALHLVTRSASSCQLVMKAIAMLRFLLHRLAWTIVVLIGVLLITFLLMHAMPGNPWDRPTAQRAMQNYMPSPEMIARLDRRFGFDLPVWRQFTRYVIGDVDEGGQFICGLICGDLGESTRQLGRPVRDILFGIPEGKTSFWDSRVGYTLRLAGLAFLFAVGLGLPIGVVAAVRHDSRFDRASTLLMTMGMSIPNFAIGLLVVVTLASGLGLISVIPDWSQPQAWLVPAFLLAIAPMGSIGRMTRTATLEVMHRDYVRTARSKGLGESAVIARHVLRNALIPIVTLLGPVLVELIAGSFVIEAMFGFPGFGREYWLALTNLDYGMIAGVTLLYAGLIVLVNLLIDMLYGVIDPRVRGS
jgi:oligopeptide transport system permease protein